MAQIIKSMSDLTKILESRIQQALKMTQDDIWEAVKFHIEEYYNEYDPTYYKPRTRKFAESLIKTQIIKNNGGLSCSVGIDPDYLTYKYPGNPLEPQIEHYNPATGYDVATWANQGLHGYSVQDDDFGHFWDDAMQDLGLKVGILRIMKDNLRKCGVPVK